MNPANIGKKIKQLRSDRSWTQKELAEKLNFSESFISYIEKGLRSVSLSDLKKVAEIFNVDFDYFLEEPIAVTHFRGESKINDNTDYQKVIDDFLKYVKNKT